MFNYILDKLQEIWVISSFFAVCHGLLNDKGLHDFEKRMIISKLLGDGLQPPAPPVATGLHTDSASKLNI